MQAYNNLQNRIKEGYNKLPGEITYAVNTVIPGTPNTKKEYLSDGQVALRYRNKVEGNPEVDVNKIVERERAKIPKIVARETQELDFFGPINSGLGKFDATVRQGVADVRTLTAKRDASEENASPDYALEWTAPEGCEQSVNFTLKSTDMVCTWVNEQNKLSSNPVKATVDIIGNLHEDFPMFSVPTMFDDRMIDLFVKSLSTKRPIYVETDYKIEMRVDISILATPENCVAIKAKLPAATSLAWGCHELKGLDPVQQIDDFIRAHYQNYQAISSDCGLLLSPLLMEEWAKKSKLLRENGLAAIAVRAKDWKAFNYGLIAAGAAAGLLCVTGIVVRCRDRIGKTIKQVGVKMGCIAGDDQGADADISTDSAIEVETAGSVTEQVAADENSQVDISVVINSVDSTSSDKSSVNW
jgi:hypothetical protein